MKPISPDPFDHILITDIGEQDSFPIDLIVTSLATGEVVCRNRIFTSKKVIDVSHIEPGTYRLEMKNEHGLVYEGFAKKNH